MEHLLTKLVIALMISHLLAYMSQHQLFWGGGLGGIEA